MANKFYGALFDDVRVIWYEAAEDLDATTVFTRLNVGRIPLTDAELVKALLLSRARGDGRRGDRALEIAAQWDTFERDLRDPELWAFITGSATESPTHISLLLDSIAGGPTGRDRPPFHTFETLRPRIVEDPLGFWDEVVDRHSLVMGWFEDRDLFHKIGFLIAERTSFNDLITRSRGLEKSRFEAELDRLIRDKLKATESELRDLTYKSAKAARALLLMNVETVRQRRSSTERYSFQQHALRRWSLEHIHAQNAEPLVRAEQWEEWLRRHRKALAAMDHIGDGLKAPVLERVDQVVATPPVKESDFRPLEVELTRLLSPSGDDLEGDVDSIANLALLDSGDNSALSNSVFAVKRSEVLTRDRDGSYIPVCTRNVFLKYYSPAGQQQMHYWGAEDRGYYLDALVDALAPYLLPEAVNA